jgi:hypothetical protein
MPRKQKPQTKKEVGQVQPTEETVTEKPQADKVETVHFPAFIAGKPIVKLSDLQTARVIVGDERGNFFYLDPSARPNEYVLRVVPKA